MAAKDMSSVSSLILLWARPPAYTSPAATAYLRLLDLSDGEELLSRCDTIWPQYGEVIKNRKSQILNLVLNEAGGRRKSQAVVFGSGVDALSLEVASREDGVTVYEVDRDGMDAKQRLITRCAGRRISSRICCVTADLVDADAVMAALRGNGWQESMPSILVFEGISYWIPERRLFGLISRFATSDRSNTLVLEYLVRRNLIADDRAHIPELVFGEVQKEIRSETAQSRRGPAPSPARYDTARIQDLLGDATTVTDVFTLRDMERGRIGRNVYFETDKSGWIEVCRAAL